MDEVKVANDPPAAETKELQHPRCPYCASQPMTLACKELAFPNGIVLLMVWCANPECMTVITASYRGLAPPQILNPRSILS